MLGAMTSTALLRLARAFVAALFAAGGACAAAPDAAAQPAAEACPPPFVEPDLQALDKLRGAARDHGLLWRIERDGLVSHLYGTLHVGRIEWAFPGHELLGAMLQSDTLALEIAPDAAKDAMTSPPARPAGAALPAKVARRLAQRAQAECVPEQALAGHPPELQVMLVSLFVARREGLEVGLGSEWMLSSMARAQGMPVESLETAEMQLAALQAEDRSTVPAMVDAALDEIDSGRARAQVRRLAEAWAAGDHAMLEGYERWCDCLRSDADRAWFTRLIDGRNPGLADGIERLHAQGRRVLAAVGALHVVGPQGLPTLLARKGFRVERIAFPPVRR